MSGFLKTIESYRPGARTMPGSYYTAPDILALEQDRIFGRHWISVGRAADFARRGDYRLVEIAGESLIVLRDQQGDAACVLQRLSPPRHTPLPRGARDTCPRPSSARITPGPTASMAG